LMLSWTLVGWPGGNLELLCKSPEQIVSRDFPGLKEKMCEILRKFGDAFKEFPFNIVVVYFSPVNFGPAAPFFLKPTKHKASMIGYPMDDLQSWRGPYPEHVFEKQIQILSDKWGDSVEELKEICPDTIAGRTLLNYAQSAWCHFRSTYNHVRFVRQRENMSSPELRKILADEASLTMQLFELVRRNATIGFEASNHYYYTINDLMEKIVAMQILENRLNDGVVPERK